MPDFDAEDIEELSNPSWMCWPSRSGYEFAIHMGIVETATRFNIATADHFYLWLDRGIGAARFAIEYSCGRQELRTVADRRDGKILISKVPDQFKHALI